MVASPTLIRAATKPNPRDFLFFARARASCELPACRGTRTDQRDVDRGELDAEKRESAGQLAGTDGP